jgi:hypothetical protein
MVADFKLKMPGIRGTTPHKTRQCQLLPAVLRERLLAGIKAALDGGRALPQYQLGAELVHKAVCSHVIGALALDPGSGQTPG